MSITEEAAGSGTWFTGESEEEGMGEASGDTSASGASGGGCSSICNSGCDGSDGSEGFAFWDLGLGNKCFMPHGVGVGGVAGVVAPGPLLGPRMTLV